MKTKLLRILLVSVLLVAVIVPFSMMSSAMTVLLDFEDNAKYPLGDLPDSPAEGLRLDQYWGYATGGGRVQAIEYDNPLSKIKSKGLRFGRPVIGDNPTTQFNLKREHYNWSAYKNGWFVFYIDSTAIPFESTLVFKPTFTAIENEDAEEVYWGYGTDGHIIECDDAQKKLVPRASMEGYMRAPSDAKTEKRVHDQGYIAVKVSEFKNSVVGTNIVDSGYLITRVGFTGSEFTRGAERGSKLMFDNIFLANKLEYKNGELEADGRIVNKVFNPAYVVQSSATTTKKPTTTTTAKVTPGTTKAGVVAPTPSGDIVDGTTADVGTTGTFGESETTAETAVETTAEETTTTAENKQAGSGGTPGWLVPVIVVAAIVVLAGGGALVYFFVIKPKKAVS